MLSQLVLISKTFLIRVGERENEREREREREREIRMPQLENGAETVAPSNTRPNK